MARNSEKNYGRLNRLWLEKGNVKAEKRPKLSALNTSDEISFWLPSIKKELDFVLKQTEVPCYSDQKIGECRTKILHLEAEYKAFVRKFHQVNGKLRTTPWTARPYEKKNKADTQSRPVLHPSDNALVFQHLTLLKTPVLEHDQLYQDGDCMEALNTACINSTANDEKPLQFEDFSSRETGVPISKQLLHAPVIENSVSKEPKNVLGLDYSSSSDDDIPLH